MTFRQLIHALERRLSSILDVILPRYCHVCGNRLLPTEDFLCVECLLEYPLDGVFPNSEQNKMVDALYGYLPIVKANAMYKFKPHTSTANIIYDLKYHDMPQLALQLGYYAGKYLSDSNFLDGVDCIIPVPLTRRRKLDRGYNQSEQFAIGLHMASGLPVDAQSVRRRKFKKSQTKVRSADRKRNVADVFEVVDEQAIKGKHILIVDDVFTTGATTLSLGQEICKTDKDIRISVLTIGKTVH